MLMVFFPCTKQEKMHLNGLHTQAHFMKICSRTHVVSYRVCCASSKAQVNDKQKISRNETITQPKWLMFCAAKYSLFFINKKLFCTRKIHKTFSVYTESHTPYNDDAEHKKKLK